MIVASIADQEVAQVAQLSDPECQPLESLGVLGCGDQDLDYHAPDDVEGIGIFEDERSGAGFMVYFLCRQQL